MSTNWRRQIRSSKRPPSNVDRPSTPPLLRLLNKKSKRIKKKRFFQTSQLEWMAYYNKLMDEYHKVEGEINGLDLQHNLHSQIQLCREEYTAWLSSVAAVLSKCQSKENRPTRQSLQQIKDALNENTADLLCEQQDLERELSQFQRSLSGANDANSEPISMRKENVRYHEFCLANDLCASDKFGGWTSAKHQKFTKILHQIGAGGASKKLFEHIGLHFADIPNAALRVHYQWHRLHVQHIAANKSTKKEQRQRSKRDKEQQQRDELIQNSANRLASQAQSEKAQFDSKLGDLRAQMTDIGHIRSEQSKAKQERERKQRERQEMEQRAEEAQWKEHRAENQHKLDDFYQERIVKLEAMERLEREQRVRERAEQRALSKVNAERVEYRELKQNEKRATQREVAMDRAEEMALKEQRLSKLRQSVHVGLNQTHIDEAGGVHKHTESVRNRRRDEAETSGVLNLFPDHGYSDEKLFEDPKFVLMNRLISSNLHHTKYGKQCIQSTASAAPPRRDCKHSALY